MKLTGKAKDKFNEWYVTEFPDTLNNIRSSEQYVKHFEEEHPAFKYGLYKMFFDQLEVYIGTKPLKLGWTFSIYCGRIENFWSKKPIKDIIQMMIEAVEQAGEEYNKLVDRNSGQFILSKPISVINMSNCIFGAKKGK